MKKIFLVFALCLIYVSFASAQFITDIDGYTWMNYDSSTKDSVVLGYLMAMSTIIDFSADGYKVVESTERTPENIARMQLLSSIKDWALYSKTNVGDIVAKLDRFYNYSADNMKASLYLAIPWIYDKEWW